MHERSVTDPASNEWLTRAACKGVTTVDFFPSREGGGGNHGREAKALCVSCPVLVECLAECVGRNDEWGIRGGTGEDQRRYFRRLWRKRSHAESGLVDGCGCGWCVALRGWRDRLRRELVPWSHRGPDASPVVDRNGPGATHGRRITYARGCRCHPCLWSATKNAQLLAARLGVDTAAFWVSHAAEGSCYEEKRRPVDAAGDEIIVAAVRGLLVVLGVPGAEDAHLTAVSLPRERTAKTVADHPVASCHLEAA